MALLGDEAVKAYKQFFDILLDQEEGAILWHCSEGKDRTGLASLLILHALGVPPETIMEDYLLRISSHARSFVVLRMISSICIC